MPRKKSDTLVNQQVGIRLSSHEKLCAERMKLIQEAIKDLQKEVKSLREEVSTGKGIVKVLVFLGSVAAALIGFFNYK
ncbi:hypothetical protein [uncultured Mediterranean phage uvMED]|nr:hypothetical protein [uncultured Mediterranean phage uvMED]